MICKDEGVCPDCILRRRSKDCGYEPACHGPDGDGEYCIWCFGQVSHAIINDSYFSEAMDDYYGIGEIVPWDLLFPLKIWYGINWLFSGEVYPLEDERTSAIMADNIHNHSSGRELE